MSSESPGTRKFPRIGDPDWYADTPSDVLADSLEYQLNCGEPLCAEMIFEALNRYFDLEQLPPRPVDADAYPTFVVEGDATWEEARAKINQLHRDLTRGSTIIYARDWPHRHTPVTELAAQLVAQHERGEPLDDEFAFAAIDALLRIEHPTPEISVHC